jgi:heavy metal sensor kinase
MAAFFLTALALVLLGFSLTLYVLARVYLYEQVDERLDATLHALGAAVDVKPDGLEWDAEEHENHITLGMDSDAREVRWLICDGQGRRVAASRNFPLDAKLPLGMTDHSIHQTLPGEEGILWRIKQRRLVAPHSVSPEKSASPAGRAARYPVLVLTSSIQLGPLHGTLNRLALALVVLSLLLWVLAAVLGRFLGKRALTPVRQMAVAAQAIQPHQLERRLPSPGTHDELEDLKVAFNGLLNRVQEAYARQKSFTAEASHQLRTPLTAMLGHVEVALRRSRPAEDYREALQRTEQQIHHLIRIVEALLFLARAETEAGLPDLEMVDLHAWLDQRLEQWQQHPRAGDLVAELTEVPILVRAHPGLLDQLLDNLLDNASKYSAPGSPITVRLRRLADRVRLTVTDEGCGMGAEELCHVFEPFYRSPQVRHRGINGVGLGLAVVRRIATALGGSVQATSQTGAGSTFTLELPLVSGEQKVPEPAAVG